MFLRVLFCAVFCILNLTASMEANAHHAPFATWMLFIGCVLNAINMGVAMSKGDE